MNPFSTAIKVRVFRHFIIAIFCSVIFQDFVYHVAISKTKLLIFSVFHSMHNVNKIYLFVIPGIDTVVGKKVFTRLSRSECSNFILAFPKTNRVESCHDMELSCASL